MDVFQRAVNNAEKSEAKLPNTHAFVNDVGAGAVWCWEGTLASPWWERQARVRGGRLRRPGGKNPAKLGPRKNGSACAALAHRGPFPFGTRLLVEPTLMIDLRFLPV